MGTITACSSTAPGLAKLDEATSQNQQQSVFSVSQPAQEHAALLITTWMGKRWMEGRTKPKKLSKQPEKTRYFIRGFCAPEEQGKEHTHASHAERFNLYICPGA